MTYLLETDEYINKSQAIIHMIQYIKKISEKLSDCYFSSSSSLYLIHCCSWVDVSRCLIYKDLLSYFRNEKNGAHSTRLVINPFRWLINMKRIIIIIIEGLKAHRLLKEKNLIKRNNYNNLIKIRWSGHPHDFISWPISYI